MSNDYNGVDNQSALEGALAVMAPFRISLASLHIEDNGVLGSGGFGKVKRGTYLDPPSEGFPGETLVEVAVKQLSMQNDVEPLRLALRLMREIKIWSTLSHPNILEFIGFHLDQQRVEAYLISPYLNRGSLKPRLKNPDIGKSLRWQWALGFTEGLLYLHTLDPPIVHGDIKPENVLLTDREATVLCDFGISRLTEQTIPSGLTTSEGLKCSFRYCAPELLAAETPTASLAGDVWAWGLTFLETMTGREPYEGCKGHLAILNKITKTGPLPEQYPGVDDRPWDLAVRCWIRNEDQRIQINQCRSLLEFITDRPQDPGPSTQITYQRPPSLGTLTLEGDAKSLDDDVSPRKKRSTSDPAAPQTSDSHPFYSNSKRVCKPGNRASSNRSPDKSYTPHPPSGSASKNRLDKSTNPSPIRAEFPNWRVSGNNLLLRDNEEMQGYSWKPKAEISKQQSAPQATHSQPRIGANTSGNLSYVNQLDKATRTRNQMTPVILLHSSWDLGRKTSEGGMRTTKIRQTGNQEGCYFVSRIIPRGKSKAQMKSLPRLYNMREKVLREYVVCASPQRWWNKPRNTVLSSPPGVVTPLRLLV